MTAVVRRLPRDKETPRVRPMCLQCGSDIANAIRRPAAGEWVRETFHELAPGVALQLRVFAESSDPHECGPVDLVIDEEGITLGWFGENRIRCDWSELIYRLNRMILEDASR